MITGRTRVIAHVGVPTEIFKAPMIYNPWFEASGTDAVVVPMGCEAGDLTDFLPAVARLRNFAGALITMPHKQVVVALLDAVSPAVSVCGACNAVRRGADGRLEGAMFDGEGFVRGLRRKGVDPGGKRARILGAGGVGSAIAASLAGAGLVALTLEDSDPGRVDALAARLKAQFPALEIVPETAAEIVVNATPLGTGPDDPLPFDPETLQPGGFVGDVVMTGGVTPFLHAAQARGCVIQKGTDMLFEQIPAYLEFFGLPTTTPDVLRKLARIEA